MEERNDKTFMQKLEALFFPLLAAAVGIGYTAAILLNNTFDEVLASPHALILLFIFISIAWFPLRSLVLSLHPEKNDAPSDDKKKGEK